MFHIKSLELVHWDYWQRIKNIPLDAKIITIAGQNGSGKTTLLDALRTLFGLDCSMGRTYKHYARHSGQHRSHRPTSSARSSFQRSTASSRSTTVRGPVNSRRRIRPRSARPRGEAR